MKTDREKEAEKINEGNAASDFSRIAFNVFSVFALLVTGFILIIMAFFL